MTSSSMSTQQEELVQTSASAMRVPKTHLRGKRSEIHLGGLLLETHGPANRPNTLTGEYWTDRKTKGQMTFTERLPDVFTRFEDAKRAFAGA